MNFPGRSQGLSEAEQQAAMSKTMENAMQNCFVKSAMSGVMGLGMGALFGLFMASSMFDTPFHTATTATPAAPIPLRRQVASGFRDMGAKAWSTGRNFGKVGTLFAGIECGVEGFRAKNDLANGAISGCMTGGILARSAGPGAAAGGCAAFAAFGLAIDAYMRQPSDD